MRRFAIFILACLLAGFSFSSFVQAQERATFQVARYLNSLYIDGQEYDFSFMRDALLSIYKVEFTETHTNHYRPFLNRLALENSMQNAANQVKAWYELSRIDHGTLVHEGWHAFFHNFFKRHDDYYARYRHFQNRALELYPTLSASNAEEALEEAYAVFAGNTITAHRTARWIIERFDPNNAYGTTCDDLVQLVDRVWQSHYRDRVFGYYYRDSFSEYWSDQALNFYRWLSGDSSKPKEKLIFVEQDLGRRDRDWVLHFLFEGRFSRNTYKTFGASLAQVGCPVD